MNRAIVTSAGLFVGYTGVSVSRKLTPYGEKRREKNKIPLYYALDV